MDFDVVIVGFGLVGSSIAYQLNKYSSQKIAVIEQSNNYIPTKSSIGASRIGGRSLTSECDEYYELLPISNTIYKELNKYNPKIYKPCDCAIIGQDSFFLREIISSAQRNNIDIDIVQENENLSIDSCFRQLLRSEIAIIERKNARNMLGILNPTEIIKTYYSLLENKVYFLWNHEFLTHKESKQFTQIKVINNGLIKTIKTKRLIYATNANINVLKEYNLTLARQRIPVCHVEIENNDFTNIYIEALTNNFGMYAIPEILDGKHYIKLGLHNSHLYDDANLTDQQFLDKIGTIVIEKLKKFFPSMKSGFAPQFSMCEYGVTKDGLPLIGKLTSNIWVALGFNGHGCRHAPAFGKMIADSVVNNNSLYCFEVFNPLRFH